VSATQILTPLFTELPKNAFATRRCIICAPSQRIMNASSFVYMTLLINKSAEQGATRNEKARFLREYPFTPVHPSFSLSLALHFLYLYNVINLSKLVRIAVSVKTSRIKYLSLITTN